MIDRATVAEKLECYRMKIHPEGCTDKDCPYNNNAPGIGYWCCYNRLLADAVALLREQETEDTGICRVFQCKKCGFGIDDIFVNDEEKYPIIPRFCPNCGKAVKWE